jgi:hypothetical protein
MFNPNRLKLEEYDFDYISVFSATITLNKAAKLASPGK